MLVSSDQFISRLGLSRKKFRRRRYGFKLLDYSWKTQQSRFGAKVLISAVQQWLRVELIWSRLLNLTRIVYNFCWKTAPFVYMINIIIFNTIFPLEHVFIRIVIHEEKSSMKNVFSWRGGKYFRRKKMKLSIWTLFRYVLKTKFYMN